MLVWMVAEGIVVLFWVGCWMYWEFIGDGCALFEDGVCWIYGFFCE